MQFEETTEDQLLPLLDTRSANTSQQRLDTVASIGHTEVRTITVKLVREPKIHSGSGASACASTCKKRWRLLSKRRRHFSNFKC